MLFAEPHSAPLAACRTSPSQSRYSCSLTPTLMAKSAQPSVPLNIFLIWHRRQAKLLLPLLSQVKQFLPKVWEDWRSLHCAE